MKIEQEGIWSKHRTVILLMLLALLLFSFMLYSVVTKTFFYDVDVWVSAHSALMHQNILNKIVIGITHLNGVLASAFLSLGLILYFIKKKLYVELRFYLASFLGASFLFTSIKHIVARVRPQSELIDVVNYSFPSGHSTMAMTVTVAIYFIFISKIDSVKGRTLLLWAALVWPLLIAFTRVYLNVHWLSDTVAGLSLGFFWVGLLWLFCPSISRRAEANVRS